jgi:antitoxin CptB
LRRRMPQEPESGDGDRQDQGTDGAAGRVMQAGADQPLGERALSKLKWRCRRGLLENDLLIERFFQRHVASLTVGQAQALNELMELPDNDLLDLLLRRAQPQGELDRPEVMALLQLLRPDPIEVN